MITSLKLFKHIKGMKNKIRFLKDVILELNFYECEENELYIANLATLEDFRGKGIGKQGYKVCSLLAKDSGVKSFYEKLDFVFEKEESYYSHTLYRMIKTI